MNRQVFSGIALSLTLAACSTGDELADIRKFMGEVSARTTGKVTELSASDDYESFAYGAKGMRSPFDPPLAAPSGVERRAGTALAPPDRARQPLERFPLSQLVMVGALTKGGATYALVADGEGKVHRVTLGDYLGDQWGRVEHIEESRVQVTEIVPDGLGGWRERPRVLELREH